MTSNPASTVKLLPRLIRAFRMNASDTAQLEAQLLAAMKRAWVTVMTEQARALGCNSIGNAPRLGDLAELKRLAQLDAQSITDTWNKDVARELTRLFNARPRGNRYYYLENMEAWSTARDVWKSAQIALMTEKNARAYAKERFFVMNDFQNAQYVYGNPVRVVSDTCQRRRAAGLVTFEYVRRNPTPAHPNCEHEWELVTVARRNCGNVWVG